MGRFSISDLDGLVLRDVGPAVAHVVIRHRNAWHSTRVSHHRDDATVAGSFDDAARAAEGWRAPGSTFTIHQIPALSVTGPRADGGPGERFVVVDLNADVPFSTWQPASTDILINEEPLRDLVMSLAEGGEHALPGPPADSLIVWTQGDDDGPDLYNPERDLKSWRSSAPSHDEPLQWSEEPPKYEYDWSKILEIDDLYRQINDLGPRGGAIGFWPDHNMPLGRVVAGFIVLQRDDGTLFVHSSPAARAQIEMPSDAVRADLHDAIVDAMTEANT